MPGGRPTGVVSCVGLKDGLPTGECAWGTGSFAEEEPFPFESPPDPFGGGDLTSGFGFLRGRYTHNEKFTLPSDRNAHEIRIQLQRFGTRYRDEKRQIGGGCYKSPPHSGRTDPSDS
uniref:Uncharacterized protein n=1 Tax=Anopheles atroparvus TaxID=41427 RepID=A0A182JG80_ANOAO